MDHTRTFSPLFNLISSRLIIVFAHINCVLNLMYVSFFFLSAFDGIAHLQQTKNCTDKTAVPHLFGIK